MLARKSYHMLLAILMLLWFVAASFAALIIHVSHDWFMVIMPAGLGILFLYLGWQARKDLA